MSVSKHTESGYYIYKLLKRLYENLWHLTRTDEVNTMQKKRLNEYLRQLRNRIERLETRIVIVFETHEYTRPSHVPLGDGC